MQNHRPFGAGQSLGGLLGILRIQLALSDPLNRRQW